MSDPYKNPTGKQRLFLRTLFKEYAKNTHAPQRTAYMKVYGTKNPRTANTDASKLLRKPVIRALYQEALAKEDLLPATIAQKLKEHLNAKVQVYNRRTKKVEDQPHYKAQMEAIKETNKLLDAYPNDKVEVKGEIQGLIESLYGKA